MCVYYIFLIRPGGRLYLQTRGSRFMKYQEIKIQECVRPFVCLFVCPNHLFDSVLE